jgi:hypothetical protein
MDETVREKLSNMFFSYGIPYGPRAGADVITNNLDYETSESRRSYRLPDVRIRDVSFDWTLWLKTISASQIRGFFRADSQPRAVIIISPSQLGRDTTYLIPRPTDIPW